jgi:hypothetical protein
MAAKRTVEGIVSFAALIFAEQKKPAMGRKPQFVALSCTDGALTRMAGRWHPISSSTYHISPRRRQWLLLLHRLTMAWYES